MSIGSASLSSGDNVAFLDSQRQAETTDRELAQEVMAAAHGLQDAMDKAILAGLIVEPAFAVAGNRFANVGVSAESYLVKIRIMRRLS